jgi:hypothetical protein
MPAARLVCPLKLTRPRLQPWPRTAQASAALSAGDYEPDEQPRWEAVHVFGTAQGVGRRSMRGGTAGAVLAAPRAPFNRKSAS